MQRGFSGILVGVLGLIGVVAAIYIGSLIIRFNKDAKLADEKRKATEQLSANSSSWKIYKDKDGFYEFEYPTNWTIKFSKPGNFQMGGPNNANASDKQDVDVKGPEGEFEILWTDNYGGGCGSGYEKLALKNATAEACSGVDEKDQESWGGMQKQLDEKTHIGVFFHATANSPSSKNRDTILKIFSSLSLNMQNVVDKTKGILSTEGQSCGRNAGPAGDAKCAEGLRCVYKNSQEEQDGIGTCVK